MCQALNHSRGTHATGIGSLLRRLARRSLKPQLNQIRTWVRQGRTDAWIAHQLEVSVGDIRSFKREHELVPGEGPTEGDDGPAVSEELDLRAEDDALVAAASVVTEDVPARKIVLGTPARVWRDVPVEQLLENQGWVDA